MFFIGDKRSTGRTLAMSTIDKRNQQLKFEIWDVNKPFEPDAKVVGSNLGQSILFFIDKNRAN